MAYYDNPTMLDIQLKNMAGYCQEIKDHLELIIVDDCSPRWPAKIRDIGFPVSLYRTKVDVAWNQDFCRNLGAYHAQGEWLFLTDIDHIIPESTIKYLLEPKTKLKLGVAYRFARRSAPLMMPYKLHPNSWLMSKAFYWQMGGYDERFAGYYGTDGDFRDRINKHTEIIDLPCHIVRIGRETIPDASTTTLVRKSKESGEAIQRIKRERGDAGPRVLTFDWERVC